VKVEEAVGGERAEGGKKGQKNVVFFLKNVVSIFL
jgi:hypothetical protein